jgi:hypothetical protein
LNRDQVDEFRIDQMDMAIATLKSPDAPLPTVELLDSDFRFQADELRLWRAAENLWNQTHRFVQSYFPNNSPAQEAFNAALPALKQAIHPFWNALQKDEADGDALAPLIARAVADFRSLFAEISDGEDLAYPIEIALENCDMAVERFDAHEPPDFALLGL